MTEKTTGPIWDVLWKINQVVIPVILLWATWVTTQQFQDIAHRSSPHAEVPYERGEGLALELRLVEKIHSLSDAIDSKIHNIQSEMAELPPDDWERKIDNTSKTVQENSVRLARIEALLDTFIDKE